eukprot:NODE_496_length_914_cov_815.001156_g381_i0.p1 GENE.NODE_496_length_914_cov_815.001156_g381_i0~~NODE_496_length_914_cov_815.001156_g381_i0.p1  ORF type:complete len:282 (-),score=57.80 NODE_496_length_914_cov_815.001156_g381_i0:68-886(-)
MGCANINVCDGFGFSPVFIAAQRNSVDCLRMLVAASADVNKCRDDTKVSPVYIAAFENNVNCLRILIDASANVHSCRDSGESPVFISVFKNSVGCLRMLIDSSADINQRNARGVGPVYAAVWSNSSDCLRLLIRHSADLRTADGRRPLLQEAVDKGNTANVCVLLQAGCSPTNLNLAPASGEVQFPFEHRLHHWRPDLHFHCRDATLVGVILHALNCDYFTPGFVPGDVFFEILTFFTGAWRPNAEAGCVDVTHAHNYYDFPLWHIFASLLF